VIELIKDFKLIKEMPKEEWQKIINNQKSFFKNRQFPRFFQSYLYLKSERRYFYYGYIDNSFILIKKKKEFGNKICYLVLPPLSLDGNLSKELDLINKFSDFGIKTKVSDEDILLYNIEKKSLLKDKDNIEMIYDLDHYNNFNSRDLSNFRYSTNLLNKSGLNCEVLTKLSDEDIANTTEQLKSWSKKKREQGIKSEGDHCHLWFNDHENLFFKISNSSNQIITSSIVEKIDDFKYILTTNYYNYDLAVPKLDIIKANHWWIMNYLPNGSLLNSGSGGWDKGLTQHKRNLRPVKELQIFETKNKRKLTEEEYQSICIGGELLPLKSGRFLSL
jgi:hypothetical protein